MDVLRIIGGSYPILLVDALNPVDDVEFSNIGSGNYFWLFSLGTGCKELFIKSSEQGYKFSRGKI